MNLFNWYSNVAGKVRAVITILAAFAGFLTSPAMADVPYVATIALGVLAVQQFLTRFTSVGNAKA